MTAERSAPATPADLLVRRMNFDFSGVPRAWFLDDPVVTHLSNGLHMVFPKGERFFVRSVRHYQDRIDDPALLARIRGFVGQEASHGMEHEASFRMLEAQGYDIRGWMSWYDTWAFRRLERLAPPLLRLSGTVALEHLTATLGETALTDGLLDHADPTMAALLRWHAAEEIEHKSVAFDVFEAVSGSWLVRAAGMLLGLAVLLFFWGSAARHLMRQDGGYTRADRRAARQRVRQLGFDRRKTLGAAFATYLRPGFHPDQVDNLGIARDYLESVGRLAG